MNLDFRLLRYIDYWLLIVTLLLVGIGIFAVASATRGSGEPVFSNPYVYKQTAGVIIGLVAMAFLLLFDYTEFTNMYRALYWGSLILLGLVLAIGTPIKGAKSWFSLGPIQFQPSEITKVALILTLGWLLARTETLALWWQVLPALFHAFPSLLLVFVQPDLGTALVLVSIVAVMLYMAGAPGWRFAVGGLTAVAAVVGLVYGHVHFGFKIPLMGHQVPRLTCWLYPNSDVQNACYNVYQSRIAVASGGLWGVGYGRSAVFVPENHTDFIFALVGEEFGFAGGAVLLILFAILVQRLLNAAAHAKDRYGMLVCSGAAAMIGFHVIENVGMAMGVMPVTGIPLPFISYGPTAVVANMLAVGVVLNVYMRRYKIMF